MHTNIRPLRPGQFANSLDQARAWLSAATPADLAKVLSQCGEADRARLTLLLRDLIDEYPRELLGAPVLIDWRSPSVVVAMPSTYERAGNAELVGWLLPSASVLQPKPLPTVPVNANCASVVIAVFRAEGQTTIGDIENEWWSHLFSAIPATDSVHISARILLPLPDAIEAAQCLLPGSRPPPLYFLQDDARAWAIGAGLVFRRDLADRVGLN